MLALTLFGAGGGGISPHLYFSTVAARRTEKSGGHGVCKSKLVHWEDTQKGFGSKKILWPGPEGLEVGPAENSGALKSGFFYFGLKFWPLNQGLHPKLSSHHIDIGLSLHLQKKLGQLVQKSPSYVNFCKA